MAKQSLRPILYKSVFQVTFRPKLKFHTAIFSRLDEIEKDYGDWQIDTSGTTVLSNFERRYSLLLRLHVIQHDQDSQSAEVESKGIGNALTVAREHFNLKVFDQILLKRTFLLPVEDSNFQSLVAILNIRLFTNEPALRQALPGTVNDLFYRVDMREGSARYNVSAGVVKREEIPKFMAFNANLHLKPENRAQEHGKILDGYPPLSLLFDINYFQDEPKPTSDTADAFVKAAMVRTQGVADALAQYLLGEKSGG